MTILEEPEVIPKRVLPTYPELLQAAELIRNKGWCAGQMFGMRGMCTTGAIYAAIVGYEKAFKRDDNRIPYEMVNENRGAQALAQYLLDHGFANTYPHKWVSDIIIDWNDADNELGGDARSQAEVIDVLETVAWS
jgi:hypothetical protein